MIAAAVEGLPRGEPALIEGEAIVVDVNRSRRERLLYRPRRSWKARREIVAVACEEPHAARILPGEDAEAVMLNLVYPAGSGRRFSCRAGQAWRHKAGLEAARGIEHGVTGRKIARLG